MRGLSLSISREVQESYKPNILKLKLHLTTQMKGFIVSAIALLALVQLMVEPAQAISCGQVDVSLAPCVPYLTQGGEPGPACCNGVKSLTALAQTTADKRAACNCVKAAANRYPNLKDDAAQALPNKCGVTMDIPVSRNVNCDLIN